MVALIDQTVEGQLKDKGIAGAVVSVVHDSAVVLSRGKPSSTPSPRPAP